MKPTPKQKEEIDWLCKHFAQGHVPSEDEIGTYIKATVNGLGSGYNRDNNEKLLNAKRRLDIQIKMWRQDIADGIIGVWEFAEEMEGYGDKIFKSIMKNIPTPINDSVGLLTPSILWANERWNLHLKSNRPQEDYYLLKKHETTPH